MKPPSADEGIEVELQGDLKCKFEETHPKSLLLEEKVAEAEQKSLRGERRMRWKPEQIPLGI